MKKVVGILAVVGLAGAAVLLMGAKKAKGKRAAKAPAAPTPTGSIPMGAPGRQMPAAAPASTTIPASAIDYGNRYAAWVNTLDPSIRNQAPPLVPAIFLQGKTDQQAAGLLQEHARQVQVWWDSVKAQQALPMATSTPVAQSADAFAELDKLVSAQMSANTPVTLPTSTQAQAGVQAQNAMLVRLAIDNYAAWYRTIPARSWPLRNWQAEAPKMPAVDLNSSGAPATVRLVYQTAAAWQSGQPASMGGVAPPPALPTGFPA